MKRNSLFGSLAFSIHLYPLTFLGVILSVGCVRLQTFDQPMADHKVPRESFSLKVPVQASARKVRIAIAVRRPVIRLTAPESFAITGVAVEGNPEFGGSQNKLREITLDVTKLISGKARLEPFGKGQIQVDGRSYQGSMDIVSDQKGTLTVINDLSLEDYVMGVLAGEVPRNWPLEALKAQAIAARTFAVLKQKESLERGDTYDLENTSLHQMYQGSELVNENIQRAVVDTAGEILAYRSAPIAAFFHSNCGGRTSSALGVWTKDQPYLKSVDCAFGDNGPHFKWSAEVSLVELGRKLHGAGFAVAEVSRLEPHSRDASDRVAALSFWDENGGSHKIKGSVFRMAVGPDIIKSTRFNVTVQGTKALFSGTGWGHGVGLCQEGACGMALKGYSAFEILRRYYHGISIEKLK